MNINLKDEFSVYLQDLTDRGVCRLGPDGYVLTDGGRWPGAELGAYIQACPFKRAAVSYMGQRLYTRPFQPAAFDRAAFISTGTPYIELLIQLMTYQV